MTTLRGRHILLGLLLAVVAGGMAQAATATRTSAFEYDAATGQLTKEIVEPDNAQLRLETLYTYDAWGNKIAATTSSPATGSAAFAARSSSTGYDARGQFPLSSTNALNQTEARVFDLQYGAMTSLTGPNGLTTTWQYDDFGRKAREIRADNTQTKWDYLFCNGVNGGTATCPAGAKYLVQITPLAADGVTANGPWSKTYYDVLERAIRSETLGFDGVSVIVQSTEYDNLGRVSRSSAPYYNGQTPIWTVPTYDAINRAVAITLPDGTQTTTSYNGFSVSTTNALNQTQTKISNSQGKVVQVIDPQNNSITYQYDAIGNLIKTTDPKGNVVSLTYDIRSRKTQMVDPDMGTWNYSYNALGELVQLTDAKGQVTTMQYDKLGRMTSRAEADLNSTWSYDSCTMGIGKPCSATADNGYARSHAYDALGRAISTTSVLDASYTALVTYDSNGRVVTQTYPNGLVVKYVYTALGYLQEVRNNATNALYWQANTMDALGHLLQQTYGNGVITQQVFNTNTGRLQNIYAGAGNGVQNFSYTYDSLGNLLTRNDANQTLNESFVYDSLNRVTSATVNSNGAGIVTQTFAYDSIGNIVSRSDMGTYSYGGVNARPHGLTQIAVTGGGTRQYTYDANGSLSQEVQLDSNNNVIATKGRTEVYTSFAMPQAIGANGYSAAFVYGPEHQRVKQIAPAATTIYLNPGNSGALLYEKDLKADGSTEHRDFITAGGQVVAVYKQVVAGGVTTTTVSYFHRDQLGSTTAITNEAGSVIERLAYEAFGKRRFPVGTTDPNNTIVGINTDRGYTNHEHLDALGLIHMNGRIYDPAIGRFMSADPTIQSPDNLQSYNRYSYVWNNPLNSTDPSGYFKWSTFLSGGIIGSGGNPLRAAMNAVQAQPGQSYVDQYVMTHSWAYSVGQIVVTAVATYFGGPAAGAGAAATYTSYYTYQATGSLNKANKEGAITFATTYAASYVSAANWGVPQTIVAQGVIGGTSAKLQGGSFEKGFMYSAAAAGAMEAYKAALNRVPSDECPKCAGYKPGYGPGEGISDKTPDISLRDPTFNNIGNGAEGAIRTGTQEGSTFSNTLNHVPLMNPMSAMHDSWTTYTPALNINANYGIPFYASIPVAYVVTLAATLSETPNVVVQLAVNDSRK